MLFNDNKSEMHIIHKDTGLKPVSFTISNNLYACGGARRFD